MYPMYLNRTIVMQDVVAFFNIIQKYIKPYKYQWQNFNNLHPKILLIATSDIYIQYEHIYALVTSSSLKPIHLPLTFLVLIYDIDLMASDTTRVYFPFAAATFYQLQTPI